MNSEKNNKKEKIIILILIIIIILLILALILKEGKKVPASTSSLIGDTFEITIEKNEETAGVIISDEDQAFENEQEINIFKNVSEYSKEETIAPTSNGTYKFNVKNTNDFDIKLKLKFREENPYEINIKYRLKLDENYICGLEETWISADEIETHEIAIKSGESIELKLDWYWFEGENDTKVGINIDSYYKIFMQIDATD